MFRWWSEHRASKTNGRSTTRRTRRHLLRRFLTSQDSRNRIGMGGQSLVPWLERNGQGEGEGAAFCQYLAKNDIYKPIKHGTLGAIEGGYQYVLYIDTQKGELRPLNERRSWNLDRARKIPRRQPLA